MKRERRIDPKLQLEARQLSKRLMGTASTRVAPKNVSLYDLWLGDLSALAKVSKAALPGLQPSLLP